MSDNLPPELQAELLDDFYSEADEHLGAIRDSLVALESSIGQAKAGVPAIEKLFRSFHSFKGISAIVGLKPAESLAHHSEDYLRDLSKGRSILTREGVDLLMSATHRLEQVVRAHREKLPLPDVTPLIDQLGRFVAPQETAEPAASSSTIGQSPGIASAVESARANGAVVWLCTFAPSPELDARGVNVNSVRGRLGQIGEILRAKPDVRPGGKIIFEFVVSLRETLSNLDDWERDGVKFSPLEQPEGQGTAASSAATGEELDHNPFVAPSHVVRVDLSRLDDLMRIAGELVVHRSRLDQQVTHSARSDAPIDREEMEEVNDLFARSLRDLREAIMRVRLVPVAEIFSRMPFVVRDLSRETQKQIRLTLSGQQTEIDKFLIERLKDPLLHLVRNSVTHGCEDPSERSKLGKPIEATISLSASTIGDHVLITVEDDGRGVDRKKVAEHAARQSLPVPEILDDNAVLTLLCAPGFSTRDEADRGAGRGVGMAVVNNTVRELGGTLSMDSQPGRGTRFFLRLPLTLAIAEAFIVSCGDQTFAVPQTFVQEIVQMTADQIHRVDRTELMTYRDSVLPLFRLSSLIKARETTQLRSLVLVLSSERGTVGLVVDQIHGQREVVVRAIRDPLIKVPGVAGATELGDGRLVLILDAAALTNGVVRPHQKSSAAAPPASLAIAS